MLEFCYDMHSQNAVKMLEILGFFATCHGHKTLEILFFVNSTIKMLEFPGFFVNSTVIKRKEQLSFWPVAHRNRRI